MALADSCNNFTIKIANATEQTCKLTEEDVVHGRYDGDEAPVAIAPNTAKTFKMTTIIGSLFGPKIQLTYNCGSAGSVNFTSKQNYCAFEANEKNTPKLLQLL